MKCQEQTRSPIQLLKNKTKALDLKIAWLAGDGSDRSYFRLSTSHKGNSWVLMQLGEHDQLALRNHHYDWIAIKDLLLKAGVRVPNLYHTLSEYGELIIEDCEDCLFEQEIIKFTKNNEQAKVEELYLKSFSVIAKMLKIRKSAGAPWCQRAFDLEKLKYELNFFVEHYICGYLNLKLSQEENRLLNHDIDSLCNFLASRPQFFVHRDFHSRNLLVKNEELIIIDFQDAMLGPCAYDLVSLCYDSYIPIHTALRNKLFAEGKHYLSRMVDPIIDQELAITVKAMLLQRQLKALGSFAYLSLEKKRGDYLRYRKPAIATLERAYDKRWPFLSGDMLEKIQ